MKALIHWTEAAAGGRPSLPTGTRYVAPSRWYPEDGPTWPPADVWSVYIDFETPPANQGNPSIGMVHFPSSEAPHDRLQVGRSFDLYEGARKVARVELVPDDPPVNVVLPSAS